MSTRYRKTHRPLPSPPSQVSSRTPTNGESNVSPDRNIVINFNESVQAGAGTITITGYSGKLSLSTFDFKASHSL